MNTTKTEDCIEACNRLLRGEISAIETYNQAIEKFEREPEIAVLKEIRVEHVESANRLRHHVRSMGGEPSNDSGAWGTFAKTIEGAAKLFGETSALNALVQGEEHGQQEYEEALDDDVMREIKEIIRAELLPRQRSHVSTLRGLARSS